YRIVPMALLLALLTGFLLGPTTPAFAADSGSQSCQRGTPRWGGASLAECPDGERSKPNEEEKKQDKKQEQDRKQEQGKKPPAGAGTSSDGPYAGDDPKDAPGQWAKSGAEGAHGMAKDLKERIDSGELGKVEGFW